MRISDWSSDVCSSDLLFRLQALMKPLARKEATVKAPRSEVRRAHWIEPKLVAEIAYTELTREGTLRHPSYLGLREDQKPEAVVHAPEADVATATPPAGTPISNRHRRH